MPQASFVSRFTDVWVTGKTEILDDLLPADVVYHMPPFADMDRDSLKQFITDFHRAFPDFSITIDQELSDGDTTAARWTSAGTFTGESPLLPMAPTGKAARGVGGAHFIRWSNERPVEIWHIADWMGGLQQCGVLPPLG